MIPEAAVEAAARAMAPAVWGPQVWTFVAHGEAPAAARDRVRRESLEQARAALEAAAPHVARSPMMDEAKAHAWDAGARMRRDEHGHVIADNPYSPAP